MHDKAFIPFIINTARNKSVSGYVGDCSNRLPAVHRLDAAHLFRLALEKAITGNCYNAIGVEDITMRTIAEVIGKNLNLPVVSISPDKAAEHFEWISRVIVFDSPATSIITQKKIGWQATHIGLVEDMEQHYF